MKVLPNRNDKLMLD